MDWIHVFLPSFVEIDKAEVTKRVHGIHHEQRLVFSLITVTSGAILATILRDHFFPIPIPLPNVVQICPVFKEMYPQVSSRLIIY